MLKDGMYRNANIGGGYFYCTRRGVLSLSSDKSVLLFTYLVSKIGYDSIYVKLNDSMYSKMLGYVGLTSRQQLYYYLKKLRDRALIAKCGKNKYAINPNMFFYGNISRSKSMCLEFSELVENKYYDEDIVVTEMPEDII